LASLKNLTVLKPLVIPDGIVSGVQEVPLSEVLNRPVEVAAQQYGVFCT